MSKQAIKIQEGRIVDYTATATIANGNVIVLANRIGIAQGNAEVGEVIALELVGVYEITATTADAIAFGDVVYFDNTAKEITTTATDNTLAGIAINAKAGATAGTIQVRIG